LKDAEAKNYLADELVSFDSNTSQMVNYHFLLQYINKLLEELPPRQKEVIQLRKLEEYSLKEIAKKLNISIKTVESHLSIALKFLREKLQNEKFDDLLLLVLVIKKNKLN
jgi:RNA polymerase sigma-70 factor (ECF subfamily)